MSDHLDQFLLNSHHSHSNLFGGQDFYDATGIKVASTHDNLMGGHDIYDATGQKIAATHATATGTDVYAAGKKIMFTQSSAMGEQLYNQDHQNLGNFQQHVEGSLMFQDPMGQFQSWHQNLFGGMTTDPLTHMSRIQFPKFFI